MMKMKMNMNLSVASGVINPDLKSTRHFHVHVKVKSLLELESEGLAFSQLCVNSLYDQSRVEINTLTFNLYSRWNSYL